MNDNKYFSKYINQLSKLTSEQINDTNLLDVFCEYISSNPDFKYNGTYLRDSLEAFREKLDVYNQKRELIFSFGKKLSLTYESLENLYIIIDNLYVIMPDFKIELLCNLGKYSYFNNLASEFNLFKLEPDYISIRYVKLEINEIDEFFEIEIANEYLEKQKIKSNNFYKEIELFSLVKKILTSKNKVIEGEKDDEKQII